MFKKKPKYCDIVTLVQKKFQQQISNKLPNLKLMLIYLCVSD